MSDDRITTQDMASPRTAGEDRTGGEFDPDEPVRDQRGDDLPPPPSQVDDERTAVDDARRDATGQEETAGDRPGGASEHGPLLDPTSSADYQQRWDRLQIDFVDRPRETVAEADELVAEVLQRIAQTFADERSTLEQQWSGDGDPSTEELRVSLQRYRAFFSRLLST